MRPNAGKLQQRVLKQVAAEHALSWGRELLDPSAEPAAHAYRFVSCGTEILATYTRREYFPAANKRVAKRGSKWVAKSFGSNGSRDAAVLLAQALATERQEIFRRRDAAEAAASEMAIRDLIQEHHPLDASILAVFETALAEYRTFDTHAVRLEIRAGVESGTGYHMALLTPGFIDGETPDEDEELVNVQMNYASRFFRRYVGFKAIELAIGSDRFASMAPDLVRPGSHAAFDEDLADSTWWTSVGEEWSNYRELWQGSDPGPSESALGMASFWS